MHYLQNYLYKTGQHICVLTVMIRDWANICTYNNIIFYNGLNKKKSFK